MAAGSERGGARCRNGRDTSSDPPLLVPGDVATAGPRQRCAPATAPPRARCSVAERPDAPADGLANPAASHGERDAAAVPPRCAPRGAAGVRPRTGTIAPEPRARTRDETAPRPWPATAR